MKKRAKNGDGFTLAELLIVVAIIGILCAIAIPVLAALPGKAEENVCKANRSTLYRGYVYAKTLDYSLSLDYYLAHSSTSETAICPSGGSFSADASGTTVLCSVHNGSGGSGGNNHENSTTSFYLKDVNGNALRFSSSGDLEELTSQFFSENPKGSLTYSAGEIFFYQGSYYVWKRDTTIYASSDIPSVTNWYSAEVDMNNPIGYLDVSTGKIISGDKVTKGSMFYVDLEGNGTYTLAYNRGESSWDTGTELNNWYLGPNGKKYWVVLGESQGTPS